METFTKRLQTAAFPLLYYAIIYTRALIVQTRVALWHQTLSLLRTYITRPGIGWKFRVSGKFDYTRCDWLEIPVTIVRAPLYITQVAFLIIFTDFSAALARICLHCLIIALLSYSSQVLISLIWLLDQFWLACISWIWIHNGLGHWCFGKCKIIYLIISEYRMIFNDTFKIDEMAKYCISIYM